MQLTVGLIIMTAIMSREPAQTTMPKLSTQNSSAPSLVVAA